MAKDFVKLSEVAVMEEVSDNATVLVEENGEIYRAPKTQVGGGGGIKTAIIRDSYYLEATEYMKQSRVSDGPSYECLNMTFEEAYEIMANGDPLMVVGMLTLEAPTCLYGEATFAGVMFNGIQCIMLSFYSPAFDCNTYLYWTETGFSMDAPAGDK